MLNGPSPPPPPSRLGRLILLTLPFHRVWEWGGKTKVIVLGLLSGPQKDGVANPEATNGKPPRDLGFQDTGKQGAAGMEGRWGREGAGLSSGSRRLSSGNT